VEPQPPISDDEIAAIRLLVFLTLDPEQRFLDVLRQGKEAARRSFGREPENPDELEQIRAQLKDAVLRILEASQISVGDPVAFSTALRSMSASYCDALYTGVASWPDPKYRDEWRRVCEQVTDVASAEY
jgi:hypothetical protein